MDFASKVGQNEALFRRVNEQIERVNESFGVVANSMTVICECGDGICVDQIRLTLAEYERVRAEPTLFVLCRGHELPDVEDVVETSDDYEVVRKRPGGPAEIAKQLDERT